MLSQKRFAMVLALLLAAPAHATYHLNRINEVYPSATASQQFVELKDPVGEPFPPPDEGQPPEPAQVPEPYPPPDEGDRPRPPEIPEPTPQQDSK